MLALNMTTRIETLKTPMEAHFLIQSWPDSEREMIMDVIRQKCLDIVSRRSDNPRQRTLMTCPFDLVPRSIVAHMYLFVEPRSRIFQLHTSTFFRKAIVETFVHPEGWFGIYLVEGQRDRSKSRNMFQPCRSLNLYSNSVTILRG